ncbi:MAG: metallophosphoesterase [Cellvibrionaceae bacterium]|nr:metallophosphoesterase [Cellvibrionaceae bacterium]
MHLLDKLGYHKRNGVYQHPSRQAIFVGDIVDRGPRIREALEIVYTMVDKGHAQMVIGNHEYNVFCYATPDPRREAMAYLREHTPHNDRLVAETFEQFAHYPRELQDYLHWFSELPLFLDLPRFRVVHACWDDSYISAYREVYQTHCVSKEIIVESTDWTSIAGKVLDRLMRGTSLRLPDNEVIRSRDGYERQLFRTKFWADNPQTYGDVVYQPDPLPAHLQARQLTPVEHSQLSAYSATAKPVFFGHYWLQGCPQPVRHNLCCLDYSAVKYGRLVAYRMTDEHCINPDNYVWVYVDPRGC